MITLLSFLFATALILIPADWLSGLLEPNNLAEIGVVILGIIALSASVQIRILFEKAQSILRLYVQYTDPKSENGSKLSAKEKERLLAMFLSEIRIIVDQYSRKLLVRIGGIFRKF